MSLTTGPRIQISPPPQTRCQPRSRRFCFSRHQSTFAPGPHPDVLLARRRLPSITFRDWSNEWAAAAVTLLDYEQWLEGACLSPPILPRTILHHTWQTKDRVSYTPASQ